MRIALIDDDSAQSDVLSEMIGDELSRYGYRGYDIDIFENSEVFFKSWKSGAYDIIFMDIFMGRLNGVEAARRIRETDETVRLVFCTVSNEYASESYEVNAQYYLKKPVTRDVVSAVFQRLNLDVMERQKTITLPDGYNVMLRKIIYTEYFNHVITIHMNGEDPHRIRISQSELETILLSEDYFFSPVKGIIINFHEVEKITKENFIMKDGKIMHITRRRYKQAKEAYTRFRFEKMRKEVENQCTEPSPPLYRISEVAIYSILNFLPFILLALYPFRKHLRFSNAVTVILIIILSCLQIILRSMAVLGAEDKGILTNVSTFIYIVFYFIIVNAHCGKTLFTLLMLSNIAEFVVIASKCTEVLIFGREMAIQSYRWTFSVSMAVVSIIVLVPIFFYFKNYYSDGINKQAGSASWNYLWLIPATFYFLWIWRYYGSDKSALEIAMEPSSVLFSLGVNMGAFLIYHTVLRLINEQERSQLLSEQNHQLVIQNIQYENLNKQIDATRKARHDMRHHITMMSGYLSAGQYEKAREYLQSYENTFPGDSTVFFCKHYAVNTILMYFAHQAENNKIDFSVSADLPASLKIPDNVLSVLLGNLLENALEACMHVKKRRPFITVKAKSDKDSVFFQIENNYSKEPATDPEGRYLSAKHDGIGIGIESVKSIADQYDGMMGIRAENGIFSVSVFLTVI